MQTRASQEHHSRRGWLQFVMPQRAMIPLISRFEHSLMSVTQRNGRCRTRMVCGQNKVQNTLIKWDRGHNFRTTGGWASPCRELHIFFCSCFGHKFSVFCIRVLMLLNAGDVSGARPRPGALHLFSRPRLESEYRCLSLSTNAAQPHVAFRTHRNSTSSSA